MNYLNHIFISPTKLTSSGCSPSCSSGYLCLILFPRFTPFKERTFKNDSLLMIWCGPFFSSFGTVRPGRHCSCISFRPVAMERGDRRPSDPFFSVLFCSVLFCSFLFFPSPFLCLCAYFFFRWWCSLFRFCFPWNGRGTQAGARAIDHGAARGTWWIGGWTRIKTAPSGPLRRRRSTCRRR